MQKFITEKTRFANSIIFDIKLYNNAIISDGYTISDVVMYWRDEPVVGVEVGYILTLMGLPIAFPL